MCCFSFCWYFHRVLLFQPSAVAIDVLLAVHCIPCSGLGFVEWCRCIKTKSAVYCDTTVSATLFRVIRLEFTRETLLFIVPLCAPPTEVFSRQFSFVLPGMIFLTPLCVCAVSNIRPFFAHLFCFWAGQQSGAMGVHEAGRSEVVLQYIPMCLVSTFVSVCYALQRHLLAPRAGDIDACAAVHSLR